MKKTLEKLKAEHLGLFCDRPFAVGVGQQLMTLHPDIPKSQIRAAMRFYCGSLNYQRALVKGIRRINLDLSDGELPTDSEKHQAAMRWAKIKATMKAHKLAKQSAIQKPDPVGL